MNVRFAARQQLNFSPAIKKEDQQRIQAVFDAAIQYRPDRRFVMDNTNDKIEITVRPFPSSGPKREASELGPHDMLDISVSIRDRIHRTVRDPHINQPPNGSGSDSHWFHAESSVDLVRPGGGGGDYLTIQRLTDTDGDKSVGPFVNRVVDHLMGSITMLDAAYKAARKAVVGRENRMSKNPPAGWRG